MTHPIKIFGTTILVAALFALGFGLEANSEGAGWLVSKSSGDVFVTTMGAQPVALTDGGILKSGDNIRTGRNGRVLLVRGDETILIAPNSDIGLPAAQKDGLATTVLQRAGSILLEVEKRNVQHFEVETPYLAAVVKGTQFRVTVDKNDAHVDVLRGQVEVSDFKSGQYVLIQPGQTAKVSALLPVGLSLSGSGSFSPIQQGSPRNSSVTPAPATNDNAPIQEAAPQFRQAQVARPAGGLMSMQPSSEKGGGEYGLIRALFAGDKDEDGSAARKKRGEQINYMIAMAIGGIVTVGVAVQRRRQRRSGDRRDS